MTRIRILFFLWLPLICSLKAQVPDAGGDTRYSRYQHILLESQDSLRCARLLHYAGKLADSLHDYNLSILIFEKVNAILKQKPYLTLARDLAYKWAYTYYEKGDYETADLLYTRCLKNPTIGSDPLLKADILNRAGVNAQNLSAFKRAMVYYNEAIELYTQLGEEKGKGMIYVNMANVFAMTGNLEKSDEFFDKAMALYTRIHEAEKYQIVLGNKAVIKWKLGQLAEAKKLFAESLRLDAEHPKDYSHFIFGYFNLALIYGEMKRWDSCFYYLNKGKHIADSLHLSAQFDGPYFFNLGYCYEGKGETRKAISAYKQAIRIKTGISSYQSLYDNISELYVKLKQYDTAFFYKDKSQKLTDSIYKSELKEHIAFENKRIELLEKDYQNQIKVAEKEQAVANLTKRNYLLIGLIALLSITGCFFLLYFKQHRLRQKKENLQSELDFLRAQLNPHFLFNSINNIYVLLDENKEKASEVLLKFSDLMRYQLYDCNVPAILLSKELNFIVNYIEFEKLRYLNRISVHHNLGDFASGEWRICPLLLQPFVENAFKHSPKSKSSQSTILVKAALHNNTFIFEVSNTRDASQHSELPGGIGLENVKKRLKLLYPGKHELSTHATDKLYSSVLKLNLSHD